MSLGGALLALSLAGSGVAAAAPGDLDASFATGGVFTAPFMTTFPGAEDSHTIAVDSQGRVYLSATQEAQLNGGPGLTRKINVVRLSAQGVPDPGFGIGGTVTLPTTGDVRNAGIVVDAQDRPVIAGYTGADTGSYQILLTRLTTGGAPDAGFGGGDGVVQSGLPNTSAATQPEGIGLTPGGDILVAGFMVTSVVTGFITRFDSSGVLDTAYGTGGWTAIGDSGSRAAALHVIAGGGAVLGGWDDYAEWIVARVTPGGALDITFDGDGLARSNLGKQPLDLVTSYGVTVDGQGRPVVVGQLTGGGNGSMAVARWTSAGAPDSTFGTGTPAAGVKLLPAVGGRGIDAATQCTDGKLLVTAIGAPPNLSRNSVALARLDDAGVLDPTFAAGSGAPGIGFLVAGQGNTPSDLLLTNAGAYVSGFRRDQDAMMVYTDYPQVARFAANESCGTTPPVEPPVPPPPATPPATPAASLPAAAALPVFAKLVALPSTRKCVSRRLFSIRLKVPASSSVVEAIVNVNGKRAAVRRGSRLRSTVDLRSLPKGRFRVEVVLKLADGRKVRDTRRYRTCAPKKRR